MPCVYFIKNNVLYTSNYGTDRDKNPFIPFAEFLQDCAQVNDKDFFIKLTNDMVRDEIGYMPKHFKQMYLKTIKSFRDNYDEWKQIKKYKFAS